MWKSPRLLPRFLAATLHLQIVRDGKDNFWKYVFRCLSMVSLWIGKHAFSLVSRYFGFGRQAKSTAVSEAIGGF